MLGNTAFKGDTPSLSWFNALLGNSMKTMGDNRDLSAKSKG